MMMLYLHVIVGSGVKLSVDLF